MTPDAAGSIADAGRDPGRLSGPVLLFGGPYSNLPATMAMRAEADRLGIPADRVICTGDVVAYAAEPAETVNLIRRWGVATVMGNCEESFGFAADDCGCGFEEGSDCDVLSRRWYAYADAQLGADHRAWMRDLPRTLYFTFAGRRFAVVHGSADEINAFVFAGTDDDMKTRGFDVLGVDAIVGGHSGVPFTQVFGDRLWHNSGVVGMPANDGTPRVWYSLLEEMPDGIRVSHRPLTYDHQGAARAMRANGLPESYARCLEDGLWPNMDVMPADERAKRGRPLAETVHDWPSVAAMAQI